MKITNPPKQNKSLPAQQKESNLCITFQALHMPQLSPPLKRSTDVVDLGLSSFFIQSLFPCRHFCLRLSFPCLFSGASCYNAIVTKWTSSPATPYFCRGVCLIFPASVKCKVCTRGGGRDRGGLAVRARHEGIWPIPAIRTEKHGLVSFFSVLQLPELRLFSFLFLNTWGTDYSQDTRTISPTITKCVSE